MVSMQWCHMVLLPDTYNCGLRTRRECRGRFSRHRFQTKPLVSDLSMHHGTLTTHVPWCRSGSLTRGGGENVPGIPGACATRNFTYLSRGPCQNVFTREWIANARPFVLLNVCLSILFVQIREANKIIANVLHAFRFFISDDLRGTNCWM